MGWLRWARDALGLLLGLRAVAGEGSPTARATCGRDVAVRLAAVLDAVNGVLLEVVCATDVGATALGESVGAAGAVRRTTCVGVASGDGVGLGCVCRRATCDGVGRGVGVVGSAADARAASTDVLARATAVAAGAFNSALAELGDGVGAVVSATVCVSGLVVTRC